MAYQNNAHEREMAKRRSREPTDMNIPDDVCRDFESARMYKRLREFERRLDAAIVRKRLDMDDVVKKGARKERVLRVWVSNTAKDQPWQNVGRPLEENAFDFDMGQIPTWRVKIEGRLLDEDGDEEAEAEKEGEKQVEGQKQGEEGKPAAQPKQRKKFSSFLKSLTVELGRDKDQFSEGNTIEWVRPIGPAAAKFEEVDAFEFERKGDVSIPCTIKLQLHEIPERYKLSEPLARLLDMTEDTPSAIVMALWEYVRVNGLQSQEDKRFINCNEALKAVSFSPYPYTSPSSANPIRRSSARTASFFLTSPT